MRKLAAAGIVMVVLVACGGSEPGTSSGSSPGGGSTSSFGAEERSGIATFYDADGTGNCSYEASPGAMDVVALDFPEYAQSAMCGACIRVTGPKGEVTVRVVDSCPPCEDHHLDLSEQAFAKIAEPREGRVKITYQAVACEVSGNIAFRFKEGSSKYWTAIQVRNHRVPVAKLEYQRDGAWVVMQRADYNYFIEEDGVGDQPEGLSLRVTATDGQTIEETLPRVEDGKVVEGSGQFK